MWGDTHGFDYDQQDRFVFYERKCNFNTKLLYWNDFHQFQHFCFTIAYEAWMEQKESQTHTCQQHPLNRSENVGRRPRVRLRPTG